MDTVEEAQKPGTFDVLSFVEGTAYPTDYVTLFRDVAAAKKYADLVAERMKYDGLDEATGESKAKAEELTEQIAAAQEELEASAMTFKLRGFAPGIVDEIMTAHNDPEKPEDNTADSHLIAHAIVYVTDVDGNQDNHTWTAEDVLRLKRYLAEGEYVKLLSGVANVIFNAAVFERAADAGFPRGRVDVASELSGSDSGTDSV